MPEKQAKVFLRDATGLVREFGVLDAFVVVFGIQLGLGWIPLFAATWATFPSVNIPAQFILIGILALFNGIYYVLITSVMPRAGGGGYVPLSRTIHPILGLGSSFVLVTAIILNNGYAANYTASLALSGPLGVYAAVTNNAALASFAAALPTPGWTVAIGTLVLIVTSATLLAGNRFIKTALKISFILGSLGFLAIAGVLLSTSQQQFEVAFNSFVGANSYQSVISTANSLGLTISNNWLGPTLFSLPLAMFEMLGYAWNTYFAGEIKKADKTMLIVVPLSIIALSFVLGGLALLLQHTFGDLFIKSASWLYYSYPGNYTGPTPWVTTMVVVANSSPIMVGLVILSLLAWVFLLIVSFDIIVSRHFLAWSFDRAIPSIFGSVSQKFHAPVGGIVTMTLFSEGALISYTFLPTILGVVNLTYVYIFGLIFDGLAGVALYLRKKDILEASPQLAKKKLAGVPLIALLGAYSFIFMVALFILSLLFPVLNGPFGVVTLSTIAGAFILGAISYVAMRAYQSRLGIDISYAFKEIPPE